MILTNATGVTMSQRYNQVLANSLLGQKSALPCYNNKQEQHMMA